MENKLFDKEYLTYWKKSVEKSIDGTIIAGPAVCDTYVSQLNIVDGDRILDLGCSFGRMYPVFAQYSKNVFGMDVDREVLTETSSVPYVALVCGTAEQTPFPSGYFDYIVAWGVFDVVEQEVALREANRILKPGGRILFTGKNSNYHEDDVLAFTAERNAKLKNFPNRFTQLPKLLSQQEALGFRATKAVGFARRGDLGLNAGSALEPATGVVKAYEFLVVLEKQSSPVRAAEKWTIEFSETAKGMAKEKGFGDDVLRFFRESAG